MSAESVRRHRYAPYPILEIELAGALAGGTRGDHQGNEMLFARMREARSRCVGPVLEPSCSLGHIGFRHGAGEPRFELIGYRPGGSSHAKHAQVVIAQPAAHDEHAFITQRL